MKEQSTIQKKYLKTEKISEGSYGVVYKGRNTETGQIVAIKKFKNITNEGIPVSCVRELHVLNTLKTAEHDESVQRTLKLYEVYQQKDEILMVVEWMDQTLSQIILKNQPYDVKKLFSDILKSVLQMHQNFIIHRDIKPCNIMYSHSTGMMKVLDYGMAKQIQFEDKPMTNEVGSLYYRAPQLLIGAKRYDFSIDVWSLGCVFYEILTKKILFKGENQLDQFKKILSVCGMPKPQNQIMKELMAKVNIQKIDQNWKQIEKQLSFEQLALLKNMLNLDPKERPSVSQVLNSHYFAEKV